MSDDISSTFEQPAPYPYFRPERVGITHEQLLHAAFGGSWNFHSYDGFGPDGAGGILVFHNGRGRLATFSLNTKLGELAWRVGTEGDAAPTSSYIVPMRAALGGIMQQVRQADESNWFQVLQQIAQIADAALCHTADLTS
jgi:hypothetical protein